MHELFKHAEMAWNPMKETRSRLERGALDPWAMLGPFLAVFVGCTVVTLSANQFVTESLGEALNREPQKNLLLTNAFARNFIYTVSVLIPLLTVSILPARTFAPAGKRSVLASMLTLAAASAFYHALLNAPIAFVSGVVAARDADAGALLFLVLGALAGLVNIVIVTWFWFAVLHGVLRLSITATVFIGAGTLVGLLVVVGALFVVLPSEEATEEYGIGSLTVPSGWTPAQAPATMRIPTAK